MPRPMPLAQLTSIPSLTSITSITASLLALVAFAAPVHAETLNVDAGAVVVAADGLCSLPEAVHNANADAQVDNADCPAGNGADTIVLAAGSTYTFSVPDPDHDHSALPVVTSTLSILGQGAVIERSAALGCTTDGTKDADEFRLIFVEDLTTSPPSLRLEDVTLRGGCADGSGSEANDGGALRVNAGPLTLVRVTVEDNIAHDKSGGLDLNDYRPVSIVDSTFRNNHAGGGGGAIGGNAPILIEGSTISGNTSAGDGGGGVGYVGNTYTLTVRNSTISGNSTTGLGGGGIGSEGDVRVEHSTLVGNSATGPLGGGGIGNAGTLQIKNSLVASNGAGGDCANLGTFTASGVNFDTDGTCAALDGDFTQTTGPALDLGALADNGGPTHTHLPGAASVALDVADDCDQFPDLVHDSAKPFIGMDQRDVLRPQDSDGVGGALCDVGAVEIALTPEVHLVDGGTCSLGDAIEAANLDADVGGCVDDEPGPDVLLLGADVVLTAADTVRSTLRRGAYAGLPDITSQIEIRPAEGGGTRIERHPSFTCEVVDDANEFRLLQVIEDGYLTLQGLTLANGCANQGGAVVIDQGSPALRILDSNFFDNTARSGDSLGAYGGAVYVQSGPSLLVQATLLEGNRAIGSSFAEGGALYDLGGLYVLSDSRLVSNRVQTVPRADGTTRPAKGGAAYVDRPKLSGLIFRGNQALGADATSGGGGNAAGGGLWVETEGATLTDSFFIDNEARAGQGADGVGGQASGGAVYSDNAGTIQRVTLGSNRAIGGHSAESTGGSAFGGGMSWCNPVLLEHLTLSGNEARGGDSDLGSGGKGVGGGFYLDCGFSPSVLRHATVIGNRVVAGAGPGGEGLASGGGIGLGDPLEVASSLFEGNTATASGVTTPSPCGNASPPTDDLVSLGFNVVAGPSPDCAFDEPTDQVDAGPAAFGLGDHGCTTPLPDGTCLPTHPLRLDGPATDQGNCGAPAIIADARGLSRPVDLLPLNLDDGCDAGAYEARDEDANGLDDGFEVHLIFMDGFESGNLTAWSN